MPKPKKPKRTERPFKPGDPDALDINDVLPQCGVGEETQIDIHFTNNTLALFDVPPADSGVYFPELAKLTRKLNTAFNAGARPALARRRREFGVKRLEVTIALVKGRLYITYARPVRKPR